MRSVGKVEEYFTAVAATYQTSSSGGVWNIVRRREANRFMALVGDVRGRDILELGSGAGYYTRLLLAHGAHHIWAVDLSERMLSELPTEGVTPVHGDATSVVIPRTFSTLVSAGMLEFVPSPSAALHNAARHALPGAALYILFPTASVLGRIYRRFHARHGFDITLFSPDKLGELAASAGWTCVEIRRAGPYSACAKLVRRDEGATLS